MKLVLHCFELEMAQLEGNPLANLTQLAGSLEGSGSFLLGVVGLALTGFWGRVDTEGSGAGPRMVAVVERFRFGTVAMST